MAGWKRGHSILQGLLIGIGTHISCVHDLVKPDTVETSGVMCGRSGDIGLADVEEVRTETTDELFNNDLEQSTKNESVQHAHDAVVHVPETADANLGEDNDSNRNKSCDEARHRRGYDPSAVRIGELWVDNVARLGEEYGEVPHCC